MSPRLAIIQHGDFREALRILRKDEPEPYYGMKYCVRVLEEAISEREFLLVDLDAPAEVTSFGRGTLEGIPEPVLWRFFPGTVRAALWGRQIVRRLREYQPTHLLLRTLGIPSWLVLRECARRNIRCSVIFANAFYRGNSRIRFVNRRIVRYLNEPFVDFVGNHRYPATATMIDYGLNPKKAIAWDYPDERQPGHLEVKTIREDQDWSIVYAGSVIESKGVGDIVSAVRILLKQGYPVRCTVCGDGAHLARLREQAKDIEDRLNWMGRVGNDVVFDSMRDASVVCVPTRHDYPEAMPLALTEGLLSRTPVIVSDHPIFVRALEDGVGVRFFKAGSPGILANLIQEVMSDPASYRQLSRSTEDAFSRVKCEVSFGDLIRRWKATFES